MLNHRCLLHIYVFFLRPIVTTAFNSYSDTYYIAKKRLLAFERFLYVGVFAFWEVRMADKEVWL